MITNPWRRAVCWHQWREVKADAKINGEKMKICKYCWKMEKEEEE